jgi:hypothetical protein
MAIALVAVNVMYVDVASAPAESAQLEAVGAASRVRCSIARGAICDRPGRFTPEPPTVAAPR